jgi:hypothetical protein
VGLDLLMVAELGLLLVPIASVLLVLVGVGNLTLGGSGGRPLLALLVAAAGVSIGRYLVPPALVAQRQLASVTRRLVGEWCGVAIPEPRQSLPPKTALMAEGRSNAAIAQRLVISERAVAKHTASIFGKLDLQPSGDDNRRVLAVLAYLGE